jgi:uncharacterized membrane protein YphA (DoxX/SURF4 family)
MKTVLKFIFRIIPALTFIFSGFVKAVDPVGGAIKFDDYFTAFHLTWLIPMAIPLAIIQAILEFGIGFYLLANLHTRIMAKITLWLMAFFTLLTLALAVFNPVSDCGCFGDAIKLTNWETFWKNVVVIGFTIGLYIFRKDYTSNTNKIYKSAMSVLPLIYVLWLALYSYNHLPIVDFRPYKVGVNVPSQMIIPEGAVMPKYETTFILEKDGKQQTFTIDNYPYEDSTWVFVSSESKVITEGYQPPLRDLSLMDEAQNDVTSDIVNHKGPLFLLISPKVETMNAQNIMALSELARGAEEKQIPFYLVTSSNRDKIDQFLVKNKTIFDLLQADDVTLKTIIRSNPGLVLLYDGTIVGKWHFHDIPPIRDILDQPLASAIENQTHQSSQKTVWLHIFALFFVTILVANTFKTIKIKK